MRPFWASLRDPVSETNKIYTDFLKKANKSINVRPQFFIQYDELLKKFSIQYDELLIIL